MLYFWKVFWGVFPFTALLDTVACMNMFIFLAKCEPNGRFATNEREQKHCELPRESASKAQPLIC